MPGAKRRLYRAGPPQSATHSYRVRYQGVHYVYVLRSLKDGKFYTGYTTDLRDRVATYNSGKARSTRNRRPLQLIYYKAYLVAQDAKAREQFLKSGSGKRFIRRQLAHCLSGSSR